jgi:MFS family permease
MCQVNQGEVDPSVISIDWGSIRSLHNWVDRLDLVCAAPWKIGLIGSMYALGWSVGCLMITPLGDVYGRKWPFMISTAVSLGVYLTLILSRNLLLTVIMFLFLGLTAPGKSNVGYVYILE